MHLGLVSCLINRHKAKRNSVHWTGLGYIGKCRTCGREIRRDHKSRWRITPRVAVAMTDSRELSD